MKLNFLFLLLASSMLISSCSEDEEPQLVSKWKLIEILADPGDGSGQFESVESEKTIEFFEDGTYGSNSSLCYMGPEVGTGTTGTYSTADSTISPYCGIAPTVLHFEMVGADLVVSYPCIEPCREKYEAVD
jgi:hypothetical protein